MKHNRFLTLTAAIVLASLVLPACADSIWLEGFSDQENRGVDGNGTNMVGITTWSLDTSACNFLDADDFCKVSSAEFVTQDSNGEMIWLSESIDISAYVNVGATISLSEEGTLFGTEYIRCYYKVDGGAETLFDTNGDQTDDFGSATASQSGLAGSSLQIIVKASSSVGTHRLKFDDVAVAGDLLSSEPTVNASDLTFSAVSNTQMVVGWDKGNGAGRIVVMRESTAVSQVPVDGTAYGPDAVFGSGSAIAANEYVVYAGTGTNVTVTGLSPGTVYHVAVFEYNGTGSGINYLTTFPLSGSQETATYAPVIAEGSSVTVTMSENADPTAFSLTLNATDADPGDTITWSLVRVAQHGTAQVSGTGASVSPQYVPVTYFSGTDSFRVQVADTFGNTISIRVNVRILPVNVPGKTVFIFE